MPFLAGMSASVARAALMASMRFVCGGIILQRPYMSFNGMLGIKRGDSDCVAEAVFGCPGFRMSYLAVGCILLVMPVNCCRGSGGAP